MPLFKNWAPNFLNKKRKRDLSPRLGVPILKSINCPFNASRKSYITNEYNFLLCLNQNKF
jgi:hypothetical protein